MRKKNRSFSTKLILTTSLMLSLIVLIAFGIFYYYSYKTFASNFEDYVVDEHTKQEYLDKGIKNEWVLGVTTHSIYLVQAVHGDAAADRLLERAEEQIKESKFYREEIDGKYLYYRINVDLENGERIYKYSTIKDIYLEQIPKILGMILVLIVLIWGLTYLILKNISKQLTNSIHETSNYLNRVANHDLDIEVDHDKIFNKDIAQLIDSFEHMQDKLKDQNELRESILQYVSHEMKTPIMIINSYTESAKDGIYPKDKKESFYDLILKQTDRMSNKINELLLISNLNSKSISESKKTVDLSEIFYTVYDSLSQLSPHIDKSIEVGTDLFSHVYPENIEVLFENIIINAFKYAETYIRVNCYVEGEDIIFDFTNDGKKIPEDTLKNLFKPFVKGENGSTGLGLAICKQIAMIHGGDISCESSDEYTRIKLVLPYNKG